MKNHIMVDGQLLQTNKKYSQLKLRQKEKIYQWMFEAYKKRYLELGKGPGDSEDGAIVSNVMEHIEKAGIWIPESEVYKHYRSIKANLGKRMNKENAAGKGTSDVTVQNPCLLQDDLSVPSKSSCQSFISADTVLPACANV